MRLTKFSFSIKFCIFKGNKHARNINKKFGTLTEESRSQFIETTPNLTTCKLFESKTEASEEASSSVPT